MRSYRITLYLLISFFFVFTSAQLSAAEVARDARGMHGMVAAAHPKASQIGVDILKAGGNAIDAAVAVGFGLGVLEPNASGVGGGGFMMIRLAGKNDIIYIDSRGRAPGAATGDMFELDEKGKVKPDARGFNPVAVGGRSIAVPGEVAGLLAALKKYGTMSREQVMQPAIDYAENGILV